MPEQPIEAVGEVIEALGNGVFQLTLPNGKRVPGHLPKRLAGLADTITPGCQVKLELTPYDFDKARIVALVDHA